MEFDDVPLLHAIASAAIHSIRAWDAQNLANIAWAVAKCSVLHAPLLAAISAQAMRTIGEFKALELPITLWAFATMAVKDLPLFDAISAAAMPLREQFEMLDVSNMAWDLASSSYNHGPLIDAIASQSLALLQSAGPQSYIGNPSSLCWAMWRLRQPHHERALFRRFGELGVLVELVACGIELTGNQWRRLDPVDVRMDEAMREVCFWTSGGPAGAA
eukprot:CAMPEP_0183512984 /NCGR_PEP_ID=MMETSP0371-20130417/11909_1 /TAXON_ID=268820 /ORGANISM="Peridinium aciculiferum, Strain PAER-2" /LENGTH=216 /DNA_ID=CAMNT_0025710147 /DNA_START=219 /DNA_END=865 /DNA_ORIENTATION=-